MAVAWLPHSLECGTPAGKSGPCFWIWLDLARFGFGLVDVQAVDAQACCEQALLLVLCVYVCGSIPTCPHNTSRDCWNAVCVGMGARAHLLRCAALTLPCVNGYLECRRITLPLLSMLARCGFVRKHISFVCIFIFLLVSHAACAFFPRGMCPRIRDVGIPPLGAPSHPWTA